MKQQVFLLSILLGLWLIHPTFSEPSAWNGSLVEHGTLREAVGEGRHQARADISKLSQRPHFYAVGAISKLEGEATVLDSRLVATQVSCCGSLNPVGEEASQTLQATMLLGAYVDSWEQEKLERPLTLSELEKHLGERAKSKVWSDSPAFPFLLEGELIDAKIHVINGACPVHARLNEVILPEDKKAYEVTYPVLQGKVVGFFAERSVGVRTHPGTSLHTHVVYVDPDSGKEVTGHLERFSLGSGSNLSLPR